jgi:hypothetical protein
VRLRNSHKPRDTSDRLPFDTALRDVDSVLRARFRIAWRVESELLSYVIDEAVGFRGIVGGEMSDRIGSLKMTAGFRES